MGKRILLLGAGGHAAVVTETILTLRDEENNSIYDCIDYLDDNSEKAIGKIEELINIGKNYNEVHIQMYSKAGAMTSTIIIVMLP